MVTSGLELCPASPIRCTMSGEPGSRPASQSMYAGPCGPTVVSACVCVWGADEKKSCSTTCLSFVLGTRGGGTDWKADLRRGSGEICGAAVRERALFCPCAVAP